MKQFLSYGLTGVLISALAVSMAGCSSADTDVSGKAFSSPDITYSIDGTISSEEEDQISDLLFGVFLEDINYAGYALDDNLLCNGSFEYSTTTRWNASGLTLTLGSEEEQSLVSTNPSYGVVAIDTAGGTLSNTGYSAVPIAVEKDVDYNFSAFMKAKDYSGTVKVYVTDGSTVYAEDEFTVSESSEWVKYKAVLTAEESENSNLKFVMEFASTGTLLLDGVSLETTDSTGGIKNYIYEAIADLSPKFVRFPGGCVIEGKNDDSAYDWKNSIGVNENDEVEEFTYTVVEDGVSSTVTTRGEAATRTPNTDIWETSSYYLMDYSLGFYEYFLLCDHIGASAIPILNCGLSCMTQSNGSALTGRYGNGIDDFIQDALDLVAFAKGDVNSSDENEAYWAQVRADMGHEEPFEMTYLGIGNEQWGNAYYKYYQQFLTAFETAASDNPALYGDIELIVGNGTVFGNCKNDTSNLSMNAALSYQLSGKITNLSEYGVHDHHYYMNYTDFLANTTLYDSYTREESERIDIFVGEYSANMSSNLSSTAYDFTANGWINAVAEAAYMTGLERNADIVKLAAYAPMFGNYTDNQWAVNMMFYTNTELVLTPNYYVQQLFAKNQGDSVLSVTAETGKNYTETYAISSSNGTSSTTVNKLYQIVSTDEETGDIIIKIVNASAEEINVNYAVSNASLTGVADVTVLQNDSVSAVNTRDGEEVSPRTYTLGTSKKFGYTAQAYSVTVIRAHVK